MQTLFKKQLKIVIYCTLLSGCTTGPILKNKVAKQELLNNWHITGRLSIKTANQLHNANFDWQVKNRNYNIVFYGTFGQILAKITGKTNYLATFMQAGEKPYKINDSQLLEKITGLKISLEHLRYWILGLPIPNLPFSEKEWQNGLILEQLNCKVYVKYLNNLPQKITIKYHDSQITLLIKWHKLQ